MLLQYGNQAAMKRSWIFRQNNSLPWKCLLLTALLVVGVQDAGFPVSPSCDELHYYQKVTGTVVNEVEWRLTKGDFYQLDCIMPDERHVTVTDGDYDTRSWKMTSSDGKTELVAERIDRTIIIRGRFEGEPVDKVLDIDDRPWYQATSLSLRGFLDSDDTECVFWTIRLSTLKAHKIKAVKKGVEQLEENDDHLFRIRLTLPGMLAPFWKSDYWFVQPEGMFFRFEGPSGPPGSPMTTITHNAG
jgi:hypothetical protein